MLLPCSYVEHTTNISDILLLYYTVGIYNPKKGFVSVPWQVDLKIETHLADWVVFLAGLILSAEGGFLLSSMLKTNRRVILAFLIEVF